MADKPKIVQPGAASPGAVIGAQPSEPQLIRVAKSNDAVVSEMRTFRSVTTQLFDAVNKHIAAIAANTQVLTEALEANRQLIARLDRVAAAIDANTAAIDVHRAAMQSSSEVIREHQAASAELVTAVKELAK